MTSIPETHALSTADKIEEPRADQGFEKLLDASVGLPTSPAAEAIVLPSIGEEVEDEAQVGCDAPMKTGANMSASLLAPPVRKTFGGTDPRQPWDSAFQNTEPPSATITTILDGTSIVNPRTYPDSFGSVATRILELSDLTNASTTESLPTRRESLSPRHTEKHTLADSTKPSDERVSDGPLPSFSEVQGNTAVEEHVSHLAFQLDQAIGEIYELGAQLRETQALLRESAEDHADQTEILLQQIAELREASRFSLRRNVADLETGPVQIAPRSM